MARKIVSFAGVLAVAAVAGALFWSRPTAPTPAGTTGSGGATSFESAAPAAAETAPAFSGERAYALLKEQCNFGPRPVGSEAHEKTSEWLQQQLKSVSDEVVTQKWNESIEAGPGRGTIVPCTNIFGFIRGTDDTDTDPARIVPELMLSAHWDTRPVADQDPNPANRKKPILGANDGASGVAALLELARVLHAERPKKTIVFAFWDAEDLGEFLHGARHFAVNSRRPEWKRFRAKQGILLDMIGDADLRVTRDLTSIDYAPTLWDDFHRAASELNKARYFNGRSIPVIDDHVPLNKAGIPTIDIIDFEYPYWHTLEDTPDKCSAESLQVIGDVLLHFIRRGART